MTVHEELRRLSRCFHCDVKYASNKYTDVLQNRDSAKHEIQQLVLIVDDTKNNSQTMAILYNLDKDYSN